MNIKIIKEYLRQFLQIINIIEPYTLPNVDITKPVIRLDDVIEENKCKDGEVLMEDGNCGTPMTDIKEDDDDSSDDDDDDDDDVTEKKNVKMVKF